jgi:predicted RNA-binding protein YlxR (DUF448 family)
MNPHIPTRRCASCRRTAPKSNLLRFARQKDLATGEWQVRFDPDQRLPGRGGYLCPQPECIQQALKKGTLNRVLRAPVPRELLESLVAQRTPPSP